MLNKKALAGTPSTPPVFVEDVFSTYLYTGNGSTQTITNGIDLSGKGGLVWVKTRTTNTGGGTYNNSNILADSARTPSNILRTNGTEAQDGSPSFSSFNSNGFTLGTSANTNNTGVNSVSWTFRKQAKFFDVVTYTGNSTNRTIAHNLGSVPACIIVKQTDSANNWAVYHRSIGNTNYLNLNLTSAQATASNFWNNTDPTSSVFTVGTDGEVNFSGATYVAYLFAHDAGGFGTAGSDNVISCGSYTGNGSTTGPVVTLGYEPQWLLIKRASGGTGNWFLVDNMRGLPVGSNSSALFPNTSGAEDTAAAAIDILSTGFQPKAASIYINNNTDTYIYIAIRRGPMKTPTSGTSVFYPKVHAGSSSYSVGFPTDLCLAGDQSGNALNTVAVYRLAGNSAYFGGTASTAAEQSASVCQFDLQNSFQLSYNSNNQARWHFRRAPGFFDQVCYTGTGSNTTFSHNLGVVPELMIVKRRDTTGAWDSYCSALANTEYIVLNTTAAKATGATRWNSTTPTSSVFSVGTSTTTNASAGTYVAYLFATVSGVSKVGSYTGNGSNQTIPCGFTAGARFVLIKRTDSTGDWYVWDSARGINPTTDPHLSLNTTAAEVTTDDSVDADNSGFIVNQLSATDINVNNATYIFLAIA